MAKKVKNFVLPNGEEIDISGANEHLSNLSEVGTDKLNTSKMYTTGGISTDIQGFTQLLEMLHSTFDLSKFTVVGSPTITDDGVLEGISDGNYLKINNDFGTGSWHISLKFNITSYDNLNPFLYLDYSNGIYISDLLTISVGGWGIDLFPTYSFDSFELNTDYLLDIDFDGTSTYRAVRTNSNTGIVDTDSSTSEDKLVSGLQTWDIGKDGTRYFNGSIDLKHFSITVDGKEIFSGNKTGLDIINNVEIPYTLSKTGSKIVDVAYRDRVIDLYEQEGQAGYYTIDVSNKNFTLPMGEIYGMIEDTKANIPTNNNQLTNGAGYITADYHDNTKQDVISDLATIRSGASKGATALQSIPAEYVTETELNAKGYLTSYTETDPIYTADKPNIANINLGNLSEAGLKVIKDNSGSGLEICDIGMALYVDETKGLRRYLNGQIVDINTNTRAFLNRLKDITTLHPSLLCTEEEWQTAKTMSAFGQVGKFVFNYSGDEIVSVRIPRVVNVQGLFDLQNLGMTVSAGLPNITGGINTYENRFDGASGSFSISGWSGNANYHANGGGGSVTWIYFDASRSSSIYGNSTTVQSEAIQYPYFIQIATGSETENNIVNDIELNNPFSLLDYKYSEYELNNLSWLRSNGQYNSKAVYPAVYDLLLKIYNGTETKAGVSVKLWTDTSATDYDFKINTAEETFMLPLRNGTEGMFGNMSVKGNGNAFGLTSHKGEQIVLSQGMVASSSWGLKGGVVNLPAALNSSNSTINGDRNTLGVITDSTKSGIVTDPSSAIVPEGWTLYFYVGETVQNANLIDAGRIGEQLANKQDKLSRYPIEISDKSLMPSWYVVYNDGWCEQGGTLTTGDLITFLKTFIDTNYIIVGSEVTSSQSTTFRFANKTTTSINFYTITPSCWEAKGYIR